MKKFELTILGSNSAAPAHGRFPTSQILDVNGDLILIDCGEGSQIRMQEYKIKRSKIARVLISHMHGDHVYGLPGLIGSMAHLSRKEPLIIYGPPGIKEYLETVLRLSESYIPFDLDIRELDLDGFTVLEELAQYKISAFPVNHRIKTHGYLIEEQQELLNIKSAAIQEYNLSIAEIKAAKRGEAVLRAGEAIAQDLLTHVRAKPKSYGYCADSCAYGWETDHLKGIDTLYFETTYLHEMIESAHERGHATTIEAGTLAKKLEVSRLIIGHYSSRYRNVKPLLEETQTIFPNTVLGYDGMILQI